MSRAWGNLDGHLDAGSYDDLGPECRECDAQVDDADEAGWPEWDLCPACADALAEETLAVTEEPVDYDDEHDERERAHQGIGDDGCRGGDRVR